MKTRSFIVIIFLSFAITPAFSQSAKKMADSPEALVTEATTAFNTGRYEEYGKAIHPDSLRQFRTGINMIMDASEKAGKAAQFLRPYPKFKSIQEMKQLDDPTFYAEYIRGVATQQKPEVKQALETSTIKMVGHVNESKDIIHVVYHLIMTINGEQVDTGASIATVCKDGKRWAMRLSGDVESMSVIMIEQTKSKGQVGKPDPKTSKFQTIGQIAEADGTLQVVYRATTPFGESSLKKMEVLSVKKSDPAWKAVKSGDRSTILKLIQETFTF